MRFQIEFTDEQINSGSGLMLINMLLEKLPNWDELNALRGNLKSVPEISNKDIVKSYIGTMCLGYTHFEDIGRFRKDTVFKNFLGLSTVPSISSLRLRLENLSESEGWEGVIRGLNYFHLRGCRISPVEIGGKKYIPIDIDVSVFENSKSQKEGVGLTYKKVCGYSPVFAYIGKEGYILDCELREGERHSQYNTPEFLRRSLEKAKSLELPYDIIVRMDSGFDCVENLAVCKEFGVM